MLPWSGELAGRLDEHVITSELLRDNPLGDPHERPLWVYLPPGYDAGQDRRYPVVYVIQGFTGHVAMWRNRSPYRQPFTETADAVFARGEAPPALRAIWIDAGTRDDDYLDLGAEAFRQALREVGVGDEVIRFELFDAAHAGIDYRYPLSLAWLCQRIAV